MALPAVSRTWQYQVDNTVAGQGTALAQNQNLMFAIKQALKAAGSWKSRADGAITPTGGWTCVGSSDSSTSNMTGTDLWAAATNLVWAAAASPHSWIVLKQTGIGANLHVLIDLSNSNTSIATIIISHTGFGVAFGGTDGTASVAPTALNSNTILSASNWGGTTTTATATVAHVLLTADGKSTRIILCRNSNCCAQWNFELLSVEQAGWTNPYLAGGRGSGTAAPSSDVLTAADMSSSTATLYKGFGSASMALGITAESFSDGMALDLILSANSFDSNFPIFGQRVASVTASGIGSHGLIVDQWYGLANRATGTTYPVTPGTTREFAQFGRSIQPWKGTVPVVA